MITQTQLCPPPVKLDERAHLLALAGLLHDVGKVFEPAGVELTDAETRLEQMICPTRDGRSTHRHVLYTAYALNRIRSNFGTLPADRLFAIACNHHRPSSGNLDEHILTRADWLASGHDRRPNEQETKTPITGLCSILATVGRGAANIAERAQLPTVARSFDEAAFLPGSAQDRAAYAKACSELGTQLIDALSCDWPSPSAAVEGALAACRALLASVPSSRMRGEVPDVSLFDHSQAVAAFAACLGFLHREGDLEASQLQGQYRLVALSVGGIQRFIFRVMPPVNATDSGEKGRAKRLRARSWLVSMLGLLAARRLLDSVGLPMTNCLFQAGGRAILLLPCCEEADDRLDSGIEFCRHWMHEHFAGTLRLDIGVSEPLDAAAFSSENFSATYRMASGLPDRARVLHGASLWRTAEGWREDGWIGTTPGLPIDTDAWPESLVNLGAALTKARVAVLGPQTEKSALWRRDIFGYEVALFATPPDKGVQLWLGLPENPAATTVLNAGYVPRRQASADSGGPEPVTFDELACMSTDDDGTRVPTPMLGVLKADVDDLGYLVGSAFGDRVSLGRLAGFSRALDDLFKGFLPARLADSFPHVYTVFSGGDDLLFIGPWLDIVRLAVRVRGWLDQASGDNSELTMSAGVAFAKSGAPIRALAGAASDALEIAKQDEKNAVCVGSTRMTWDRLEDALKRHRMLSRLADRGVIGTSLVYRLLCYARDAQLIGAEGPVPLSRLKWRAQMLYDLRRNLPDPQEPDEDLDAIREWLVSMHGNMANVLHTACTLALYRLRGQ